MSSYGYTSPPSSPVTSFFPIGPASPHAFSSFHTSPRDGHAMYATMGAGNGAQGGVQSSGQANSGVSTLKRLVGKK
ncbi:hypothetical protein AcW1_001051 [Taiwanofungus camphoratus]|nr:hypothetical protein AcV5_004960 [Antrodia cinnamomea]KAI0962165.1 hypothetical protein AcV7_001066 [Antrodia cinnamomea]KAI0964168.1 hypothetical protein AcW1_001051 [Antrodia cinnamomea]